MHISHIAIRNFRALAQIDSDLNPRINVIVGPNAVGKTTILQAIRITKALLAPRTPNETQQVLISLNAASPHFPQRLFLNNFAREPAQQVEIRCTYLLTDAEIEVLRASQVQLVQMIVASRMGQNFTNPAVLIQFLQSIQGREATRAVAEELAPVLTNLQRNRSLVLGVTLVPQVGQITAADPLAPSLIAFLDQRLHPSLSIFSYFPADRALPMGEVNLQLGGPDAQQQMEAHNSQPQLKYTRLKNTIINSLVTSDADKLTLQQEFEKIFTGLLKGRRIKSIHINELGLLSVLTEEVATGRLIELDALSSGEKNLSLTFLLIARSLAEGAVALFDEPELHLNPGVSRDVLSFMMDEYSKPRKIQFIMCTHSPEILSGAFSNEDCLLLHLKSPNDISRIGKRALEEYEEALQRLGISVTESLLYEGTVLVEGDDDVNVLKVGFPELLKKYMVKPRGGRIETEQAIAEIQALEAKGHKVSPLYVIFDQDSKPSQLKNSEAVKFLQWPRRCIDNYLLDTDVIAELLKDPTVTRSPISSEGEVHKLVRELAFKQLDQIAAREIYSERSYQNASLQRQDFKEAELSKLADKFFERMSLARNSIPDVPKETWIKSFLVDVDERKKKLLLTWEAKWKDLCDGKRLLSDLHKAADLTMSEASFKERIARKMRDNGSENWRLMKGLLEDLFRPPM